MVTNTHYAMGLKISFWANDQGLWFQGIIKGSHRSVNVLFLGL